LKIVCPGTPDFYQGSEMWDLRLVDPDNRRPVDFTQRCKAVHGLPRDGANPDSAFELLRDWPDGRIKIDVIRAALRCRLQYPQLYAEGDFLPIVAQGAQSENVISILRHHEGNCVLAVIPRWLARTYTQEERLPPADFWRDTTLLVPEFSPQRWMNALTGEDVESQITGKSRSLRVSDVLKRFPVALLAPARN
jgi:(1->4)-alpha-D-glucan 1-alpha-D-glucosylmutase